MALLIIFLILDGLASLVVAHAIYTNVVYTMALDLKPLQERRLDNLDKSITYFGGRLLYFQKRKKSASNLLLELTPGTVQYYDAAADLAVCDAAIKLLDDVISYLKLC